MRELNYIKSLDGLRAIAILLVILYHCTPNDNVNLGFESIPFKIASFGWSGVDLFFILSGFLITRILLNSRRNDVPLNVFVINRLLRIVPAYYFALIIIFVLIPLLTHWRTPDLTIIARHFLYVVNLWPNEPLYDDSVLTGHFWTLSVEMQFYLIFPVLFFFAKCNVHRFIAGIWFVFISYRAFAFFGSDVDTANFLIHSFRIDGLLLGALVAAIPNAFMKYKIAFYGVFTACLIYLAFIVWFSHVSIMFKVEQFSSVHQILIPTLVNIFYAQVLILILNVRWFGVIFENGVFHSISRYSYGMYIYHFMLYPIMMSKIYPHIANSYGTGNLSAAVFFIVVCLVSISCAYASFHLLEKHFLRMKKH